jgi:uncharacterized protein
MNRVVHFEVHAANPERTAAFYRAVFGWQVNEWVVPGVTMPEENRYWLLTTGASGEPGIDGGMVVRRGAPPTMGQPVNAFVCTIGVASVDETFAAALAAGGSAAVPKMPIRGVGWLAYCHDPEGNLFGIMQNDPTAA